MKTNDPEVTTCKAAGKKLHAELLKKGLVLTGVGVTEEAGKAAIAVYVRYAKDAESIPKTYDGHTVVVRQLDPPRAF